MRPFLPLGLLLLPGCPNPADQEPGSPMRAITIVITADTLSKAMADHVGLCSELQVLFGEYNLDLACMDGAVAPSSWTGESHTRFLFPQNTVGRRRAAQYPTCGDDSVLGTIRSATGGTYIFGTDNLILGDTGKDVCAIGRTVFTQGADQVFETSMAPGEIVPLPEEERPVHKAIDAFEAKVKSGGAIQMFFNALEPGGHEPRCWFDPTTAACDEVWNILADNRLVKADDDRVSTWLDPQFYGKFMHFFAVTRAKDEQRWRPLFWGMVEDGVRDRKGPMLLDRLRRILDLTRDADRLGDLRLVLVGDHGENPCVARGLGDDSLNCGHLGVPTEYTAFVPVYVSPASLAQSWVDSGLAGANGEVWSLANMGRGLLADVGVSPPESWPSPEPVGTATSWICEGPEGSGQSGVHIENGQAARCSRKTCDAVTFVPAVDAFSSSTPLTTVPDNLAPWIAAPDWFSTACGG